MKLKLAFLAVALLLAACTTDDKNPWNAEDVCPESLRGSFQDARDGKWYSYTTIGDQVWMAENLNYANEFRYCMDKYIENYCEIYGGQYQWEKWEDHLTACPAGWHLPTKAEWEEMIKSMSGEKNINKGVLRAQESWFRTLNGEIVTADPGADVCGFTAIPGGGGNRSMASEYQRTRAWWWTATLRTPGTAHIYSMTSTNNGFTRGGINSLGAHSIRCVKDGP